MFLKKLYAGRIAVCAQNEPESIKKAVVSAYTQFLEKNTIREADIVSIQFSITKDITAANPATLLRSDGFAAATALFCSVEPDIKGSLPGVIRLLIYFYGRRKPEPVYLNGAEKLRPDLCEQKHR